MTDKEFNLAILNKLYDIATRVFNEGVKVPDGNYTADDLAKMEESAFIPGYIQKGEVKTYDSLTNKVHTQTAFVGPIENVSVLSFVCSFCIVRIFHLVARFEKLAGVGSKRKIFVAEKNTGEVLRTFEIEINKNLGTLAKFTGRDNLRPMMQNVCLNIKLHHAVASDTHILQVKPFAVYPGSKWDADCGHNYPLVDGDIWKKMCALAGKGAKMVCKLVKIGVQNVWVCECCGLVSKVEAGIYPHYLSIFGRINTDKRLQLDKKTWTAAKKWIKANNTPGNTLLIRHESYSREVKFILKDVDFGIEKIAAFTCLETPFEYYSICVNAGTVVNVIGDFNLYLPTSPAKPLIYISDRNIIMQMPLYDPEGNYWELPQGKDDVFAVAGFSTEKEVGAFESCANEPSESAETATKVSDTIESKSEPTGQKNKPAKVTSKPFALDNDPKKFTFDKVGVNVGDLLTFVDGTEVIAAEGNKISFCGRLFTLSGFCKEFMPDEKRSKSNSYRGCDFFFKDGVKLTKLLKEYQKNAAAASVEEKAEEVTNVPECSLEESTEVAAAKVVLLPSVTLETAGRTITPKVNDVAAGRKGNVSKAKVIALDIGTLAKVVQISIGIPSECTADTAGVIPGEPPNMVWLTGVGNKPFASDAGGYSLAGGKVVHTLPLPPPQGEETSKLTKANQLIRKQKWKKKRQRAYWRNAQIIVCFLHCGKIRMEIICIIQHIMISACYTMGVYM